MNLGIDIHDQFSQVVVVDTDGRLRNEIRLPMDRLDELAEEYAGSKVAIEASGNYRPVYEVLSEQLDVTVATPTKNQLIAESTQKTDRLDAKRLAHLLRAGILTESYVPEEKIRELRDLLRTRKARIEE